MRSESFIVVCLLSLVLSACANPDGGVCHRPVKGEGFVVNGLDLKMVWVEPGTFMMGSPVTEEERGDSEVQHEVKLSQGYWLGKCEVILGHWKGVMGDLSSLPNSVEDDNLNYPIYMISWNQAVAFCDKLTEMERGAGRLPEGYVYTLPTEAQWEYACRAGTTGAFSGDVEDMAWFDGDVHFGALKRPNAWGFYDMHGNVFEWCWDWHGDYSKDLIVNPCGPETGEFRIVRGGRSAIRRGWPPDDYRSLLGFRLCLAPVRGGSAPSVKIRKTVEL